MKEQLNLLASSKEIVGKFSEANDVLSFSEYFCIFDSFKSVGGVTSVSESDLPPMLYIIYHYIDMFCWPCPPRAAGAIYQ